MRGVRFTKAEREWLKAFVEPQSRVESKGGRLARSVLEKIELAEMPVRRGTYLTVPDVIEAFREVLGARLLAPRHEAAGVRAQMKNRIQALGLTRADCVTAAKVAGAKWQGTIRAESIVRQADMLLAESQLSLPTSRTPPPRQSPVELGDDEI